ncbi:MAG: ribonuclease HII, partial [Clostridia bacterium]|nr:ribonuclease HII [Clostridia bacterium]
MKSGYINDQINDSKKLSEKVREKLYGEILSNCQSFGISVIDNDVIDSINILNATKQGMVNAFMQMKTKPDLLLSDAVKLNVPCECKAIIGGDGKSFNIAAASILAKVTRDKIMRDYDEIYPQYMFSKHKGYGTKQHIELIRKLGATKIHRKTFLSSVLYEQCTIWEKR